MPTATTDHPRELEITQDELLADAQGGPFNKYNAYQGAKATKAERDSLRGAVLYRARRNSRGDWRDGTHRPVVDVQRLELVQAGPAWSTFHDLDYGFARHRIATRTVLDSLARAGLSDFHRTAAALDAAVEAAR